MLDALRSFFLQCCFSLVCAIPPPPPPKQNAGLPLWVCRCLARSWSCPVPHCCLLRPHCSCPSKQLIVVCLSSRVTKSHCRWMLCNGKASVPFPAERLSVFLSSDAYKSPHSPYYQLPPKVQRHSSNQLLVTPTPPALQKLLGKAVASLWWGPLLWGF